MICRTVGHLMLLNLWPVVTSNGKFVLLNLASVKILFRSCFFYNNFLYIIYQEQLTLMTSKGLQITLPKTESTAQWGWWKLLTQEKAAIFWENFACEANPVDFNHLEKLFIFDFLEI